MVKGVMRHDKSVIYKRDTRRTVTLEKMFSVVWIHVVYRKDVNWLIGERDVN